MSVHALSWVLGPTTRGLEPGRRMVLVVLADFAGEHGLAWPSLGTVAEVAGCSPDTVRRTLKDAAEAGWLERVEHDDPRLPQEYRWIPGNRRPNVWRFLGSRGATPAAAQGSPRGRPGVAQGSRPGATQTVEPKNVEPRRSSSISWEGGPARPPLHTERDHHDCPGCAGSTWRLDDDGVAWPCEHGEAAAS